MDEALSFCSAEDFAKAMSSMGIGTDEPVVVRHSSETPPLTTLCQIYDGSGVHSSPRVWWTFRVQIWPKMSIDLSPAGFRTRECRGPQRRPHKVARAQLPHRVRPCDSAEKGERRAVMFDVLC